MRASLNAQPDDYGFSFLAFKDLREPIIIDHSREHVSSSGDHVIFDLSDDLQTGWLLVGEPEIRNGEALG